MTAITARAEARRLGSKRYFTGKACAKGHVADRFVSNSDCTECISVHVKKRTARKAAEHVARREATRAARLAAKKVREAAWRQSNADQLRSYAHAHYVANSESYKTNARTWAVRNPAKMLAVKRRRYAEARMRLPAWADTTKIAAIYQAARELGDGWEVDHEIPLHGRLVSGLHVHTNLRIIPAKMNRQKGNHYVPE